MLVCPDNPGEKKEQNMDAKNMTAALAVAVLLMAVGSVQAVMITRKEMV